MKKTNRQKKVRRFKLTNAERLCEIYKIKQTIKRLYDDFHECCELISDGCYEEGYPDHGENYDLRVANAWKYYEEDIEYFYEKLYALGGK